MEEDYYSILNSKRSDSQDSIKKNYRKLAVKWHPDKNKGNPDAEEKFKKISEAYDVLSNETKRSQYDQFGHSAFKQNSGGGGNHDPFDIFNSFFGGRVNRGGQGFDNFFTRENGQRQKPTGSNLKMDVSVSLKDITKEKSINLSYTRNDQCDSCSGTGKTMNSSIATCGQCGGRGSIYRQMGVMQIEQPCNFCNGTGTVTKNPCGSCGGHGIKSKKMQTNIKIPVGSQNGTRLRVSGMGNYDKGGYGDLYVFISVKNDKLYERDGDDIIRKLQIPFEDMILGNELTIDSLYGSVKVKIPSMSKPDSVLRINEHGIPNMNTHRKGDMYLVINPELPKKLTEEQLSIIRLYKKSK